MKTVVVLGGSGFVGRRLCPALAAAGHRVVSISRSPVVRREASVEYIDCNYDNIYQLGELYQCADMIFHLAWDTTPATSSRQSSLEVTANLLPSLRLLEYLEHHCRAVLVYVSSGGAVYGDVAVERIAEKVGPAPISYYGAGKATIELFLHAYHQQSGNPVVALRPSNIYGPGQLARQHFAVIPTMLNALREASVFSVLGDGEQQRDFLYIDDFVALCLLLVEQLPQLGSGYRVFNAGAGSAVTVNEVMAIAQKVTQLQLDSRYFPARKVDVRSVVLDCQQVSNELGWHATTGLEAGIAQTWEWLAVSEGCR